MSTRLSVVPASDEHVAMLAEFFRVAWQSTASPDEVLAARQRAAAENLSEPGRVPPAQIAIQGGRIVGYCGSIPARFWDGNAESPAYWAKGLMVLEEFRNGPVGFQLLKDLSKGLDLAAAFTVNPASNRLFAALGYRDIGALPNRIKPLRLGRIFATADLATVSPALARRHTAFALRAVRATGLPGAAGFLADQAIKVAMPITRWASVIGDRVSAREIEDLWFRVRPTLPAATVRDGRAMIARYGDGLSDPSYQFVSIRERDALKALAVIRRPRKDGDPRLGGIRVASLSDLLVAPTDRPVLDALLGGSERCAVSLGADAILCSATFSSLAPLLQRRGYLTRASNVRFFLKARGREAEWPVEVSRWWLARGDSDADAAF